jgi:hypothetical protein
MEFFTYDKKAISDSGAAGAESCLWRRQRSFITPYHPRLGHLPIRQSLRGWARVANGTLVADDGCLLQMSYSNLVPFGGIGTLADYQDLHNNGHYNTYRYTIFLGGFYDDSQSGQTIASIEAQLDGALTFTQQSGLYLLIDNHNTLPSSGNEGCPDWPANVTIWTAIAPRYATDTNVIYQIQNEPDNCSSENYADIATHMNSLYTLIRSLAPNTPIMAWTFENQMRVSLTCFLRHLA